MAASIVAHAGFVAARHRVKRSDGGPPRLREAVLKAIARGEPLAAVADVLCRRVEKLLPCVSCAVLEPTEGGLRLLGAPTLPAGYLERLSGCQVRLCGTCERTSAPFDPLQERCWASFRGLPLPAGVQSCWGRITGPVQTSARAVLLFYLEAARGLRSRERRVLNTCVHLLEVALAQDAARRQFDTIKLRFEAALSSMSQGLCFFDGQGRLLLANRRYAEIYDLDPAAIEPGMNLEQITALRVAAGSGPRMSTESYLALRSAMRRAEHPIRSIVELANGRVVEIHHQPMPDGGWVATHEDITARRGAEAKIAHLARHDPLTGIANRLLFRERLEQALAHGGGDRSSAVLCLDLDGFKPVNDNFGHPTGDLLLQQVAKRLLACVRDSDTVGRLGGDEFAILAVGLDRPERAAELAERVTSALVQPFELGGVEVTVMASVGIALSPADAATPDELLQNADIALYRAKADARGSYRFFEPAMQARLLGRAKLETELRQALALGQFELFYQPLFALERGNVCGFEALVRWRHPRRGLLLPGEFIEAAEETGLIVPLGEWVLKQACSEAARWPEGICVSVNLSPAQFRSTALIGTVRNALDAARLPASRLEVELTEALLLDKATTTRATLRALSAVGVRICMEDFGTGHSSLNCLRNFRVHRIKIDQSFVRELSDRPDSAAVVRAIVALGRSMNIVTTAEGVETEAQLARLRQEGCDEVQGFLLSAARPAAEVPLMLEGSVGRVRERALTPAA